MSAGADREASLQRALERERRIRQEAELVSERALRELYDKQQALLLLSEVTDAVTTATSLPEAATTVLELVCAHGGWSLGHAFLRDDEGRLASTGLWCGDTERFDDFRAATALVAFWPEAGWPGRVLGERKPLWLSDVKQVTRLAGTEAAGTAGLCSALALPVLVGAEVIGVLEFFSDRQLDPDAELLPLMGQIGVQLGRAAERDAADRLLHRATHDAMTGLPNRALVLDHLRRTLARRRRPPAERGAVFFLDLDGFKAVNDAIGHAAGDQILRAVAQRLSGVVRPHDVLGRLGGDEFVLLCEISDRYAIASVADRLVDALVQPFEVNGKQFRITASIGIAVAGEDRDAQALIEQADAAMYRAKELGRGRYEVFSSELREEIERRLDVHEGLRHAIERSELGLVYQPEVDLETGAVVGVEALLRWNRPSGPMMPDEFIPLAEDTGLIVPVGAWALEEALRQGQSWARAAAPPSIAVNLSVRQLSDPGLLQRIAEVLRQRDPAGPALVLEVTESVILHDTAAGMRLLRSLRALGAEIAIDDFGTGYASLSYLREFPASILKIDRSFISVLHEPETRAIVTAMIEMAHALSLTVVAEGIETAEQLRALCELGCDVGQGFYFARPGSPEDLDQLLRADAPFARQVLEARADARI